LIGPHSLDPRPDSETLIETALKLLDGDKAPSILDLGTGSGCLLIALLHELVEARGLGLDLSQETLDFAQENARNSSVSSRATFRHGSWAEGVDERFDLVISNPPYIPSADIETLAIEVRAFDPRLALDGGPDGLDAYRAIADALPSLLTPQGHAVIELGAGQGDDVSTIFRSVGLDVVTIVPDLSGVPRALVANLSRR
jgi:release factor glutamine methyltransferase